MAGDRSFLVPIIITVPRKHIFSFLDIGNFKFIFPRLPRLYYQRRYSKKEYQQRYLANDYGLFGDIEIEKMWHQHFSHGELQALLNKCGFTDIQLDGTGLFQRPLSLLALGLPFLGSFLGKLMADDDRFFDCMNCFAIATKPSR